MSPTGPGEDDLFQRLWRGDARAYRQVHERYGPRVAAIARRRLGRRLRAHLETVDVTQEAWASLARAEREAPFANERQFLAWIEAAVEHRVLHEARRWRAQCRRAERVARCPDDLDRPDPRAARPSQIVQRREEAGRLMAALDCLDRSDRRILLLRFQLGLAWQDIAAALGVSVTCVQMRCLRARRRLTALAR